MSVVLKDIVGQDMKVGDIIAYGSMHGDSACLKVGKVTKLVDKPHSYRKDIREYRITVAGIVDMPQYDPVTDSHVWKPTLSERKGCLQFPDRCVVLNPDTVAPHLKALLDGVKTQ